MEVSKTLNNSQFGSSEYIKCSCFTKSRMKESLLGLRRLKSRGVSKAMVVRSKSIQAQFPLKNILDLTELNRFKDCINDVNIGLFGYILMSPRTRW